MATTAKMTLTVSKSNTKSKVIVRTVGTYSSIPMNTIDFNMTGQPLYTSASPKAFWLAVLAAVNAQIELLP